MKHALKYRGVVVDVDANGTFVGSWKEPEPSRLTTIEEPMSVLANL